jgi:tetratricopeptide (TPR) repeat protein
MLKAFVSILFAVLTTSAFAVSPEVSRLQQDWAEIKYKQPKNQHEKKFASLLKIAEDAASKSPNDPEVLIWYGIIEASYAGARGGLGALSYVKSAKKSFERAIEIKPSALDGSAFTSLGSLYYQVPSWPIGFGDNKKALEFLKKGLAANPEGIDSNFFYGEFLFKNDDYASAEQALKKALASAPRPGRELADEGRRSEIDALLLKIAEKKK